MGDLQPHRLHEEPEDFGIGRLFWIISEAVVVADASSGTIALWNPASEALFGYTEQEAVGRSIDIIVPSELLHSHHKGLARYNETGHGPLIDSPRPVELPAVRKDGTLITVELNLSGLVRGSKRFALAVIRDVSDRKRSEEAVREAAEREREAATSLRRLDEMKNALLTAVSHDIRTPLTVLLGVSATLKRHPEIEPVQREELLERLDRAAIRLQGLLGDLLDLDRLYRGTAELSVRTIELAELIGRVLDNMYLKGRSVRVDAQRIQIEGDAGKVERIVEHLIGNAVKHTRQADQIWVRVKAVDEGVTICVEDEGPGILDEMKSDVFKAFQRLDPKDHDPGAGIGLTLVQRFAELHGGRAWVQDREGGGSKFTVFLPLRPPDSKG